MSGEPQQSTAGSRKKVVLVRRPESRPVEQQASESAPLQLPRIVSAPSTSTATTTSTGGKKKTVIVERIVRPGETLQKLTPRSETIGAPPKQKGPIVDNDGSIVEWSVLGNPEDYRQMAEINAPPAARSAAKEETAPPGQQQKAMAASAAATGQKGKRKDTTDDAIGSNVPAYEHAQLARQAKVLDRMAQQQATWQRIEENLSDKLGKDKSALAMAQSEGAVHTRHEFGIVSLAADVAAGKTERPLFEEPFYPIKGSDLVGMRRVAKSDGVERFGKPGVSTPNPPVSKYFLERRQQLREELDIVDPFEPDIEHLFVRGTSVWGRQSAITAIDTSLVPKYNVQQRNVQIDEGYEETIPYSSRGEDDGVTESSLPITPKSSGDTSYVPCSAETHYSMAVNVDDMDFRPRFGKVGPLLELSDEHISLAGAVGELISGTITVHNTGTASVFYSWRHAPPSLLQGMGAAVQSSSSFFYFNDLKGVVLPGDHHLFTFMFRSPVNGIFFDQWELVTVPSVGTNYKIGVKAVIVPKDRRVVDSMLDEARIDEELRKKSVRKAMRELVADTLVGGAIAAHERRCRVQEPECDVAARFVSSNRQMHVAYSASAIEGFSKLAAEVGIGRTWTNDLSVASLESAIAQRSVADGRMQERFEELVVAAAVPDNVGFDRPRLVSIGKRLLADVIGRLPEVAVSVLKASGFTGSVASSSLPEPVKPTGRSFAGYLERMRKQAEAKLAAVGSRAGDKQTRDKQQEAEERRDEESAANSARQETVQQGGRGRRRGWARNAALATAGSASPTTARPVATEQQQQTTVEQPEQPHSSEGKAPQGESGGASASAKATVPQSKAIGRRRRGTKDAGDDDTGASGEGTNQRSASALAQEEHEAAEARRAAIEQRKKDIAAVFRAHFVDMIDQFTKHAGPQPIRTAKELPAPTPQPSAVNAEPPTAAIPSPPPPEPPKRAPSSKNKRRPKTKTPQ